MEDSEQVRASTERLLSRGMIRDEGNRGEMTVIDQSQK